MQRTNTPTIHRDMTIEEIFQLFPERAQRLSQEMSDAGLHCAGCHAAVWETLAMGMASHGKSDEEIDQLVSKLNDVVQEPFEAEGIRITERAAKKFHEFQEKFSKKGGLRLSQKPAGCSGYTTDLDFSDKAEEEDLVYHSLGVEIHLHHSLKKNFEGSVIDYKEGLRDAGFIVSNPNVKNSCACGTSYAY